MLLSGTPNPLVIAVMSSFSSSLHLQKLSLLAGTSNAYGLFPIGDTEHVLNDHYHGGALRTYGLDVGYAITPQWEASIGYYYQHGDDLTEEDGSGVLAQLSYEISSGLTLGVNLSYDEAFDTRVSGNIEYRFGSNTSSTTTEKKAWKTPVIQSLTESVKHRDVRVHDGAKITAQPCNKLSSLENTNDNVYHCTRPTKLNWNQHQLTWATTTRDQLHSQLKTY